MAPQDGSRRRPNTGKDDFDGRDLLVGRPEGEAAARPGAGADKTPQAAPSSPHGARDDHDDHKDANREILKTVRALVARLDAIQEAPEPEHEIAEALARGTAALTQAVEDARGALAKAADLVAAGRDGAAEAARTLAEGAAALKTQGEALDQRIRATDRQSAVPEEGWTDIGLGEDATLVRYRPAGCEEQSYVVIRRRRDRGQTLLLPVYTVILVSRDDLPLDELVRHHRGKQGQENAFKGPLIDLDLHHPPCRKFRANQAFYICGQLAQQLLRAVQYQLLPARARRHGLRSLIRYLARVVGRLVRNGRRLRLDFARTNFRLGWLYNAPTDRRIHLIPHPAGHDRTGSGIAVPENPHPELQSLPCSTLSGNRGPATIAPAASVD